MDQYENKNDWIDEVTRLVKRRGIPNIKGLVTDATEAVKNVPGAHLLSDTVKTFKPVVKKGAKYVLPVAGSVLANMNRSAISAEYEENPTNINLARKTVAQVQEGIEYVDTATLGATGLFTWIPNLMGDATEYILRTVQTPQTKEESDKEIDQLGDKFYTF